jgi:hypothetical protein
VYGAALGGWVYIILYSLLTLLDWLSSRTNGLISISLAGLATLLFILEFHRYENAIDQPKPTEEMAETEKAAQKSFCKGGKVEGKGLTNQQAERFAATIQERINWYLRGRRLWSFAHYSTLFVAGISSAVAAIIPQLQGFNDVYQKDLASILAGLAALLIALNTTGGFGRKWQANRSSSSKISRLQNELIARDPTTADIDRLNQIEDEHSGAIAGA